MKKDDLRTGMVVVTRNGNRYMVCRNGTDGDRLNRCGFYLSLNNINDDLKHICGMQNDKDLDIIAVYKQPHTCDILDDLAKHGDFMINKYDLVWKRHEVKAMTIEEVITELGYEIKIVDKK